MATDHRDQAVAALARERVDHRFKGLPPNAEGLTVGELAAERRSLFTGGFTTPVLALSAEALEHNLVAMERYSAAHGLAFAPHGKTSLAPQLFERQLAHGAWGITAAVPTQVRIYRAFGIQRIFLANEVVDAAALHWLAAELDADPEFRFIAYVDSVRGVELMDAALREAGARRPVDVVVELGGGEGARTGVRTEAECAAVADAVAAAGPLRLVGVAGYEGEVPKPDGERVRAWLRRLTALAADFDAAGRFEDVDEVVVSAGGSAWFDAVADVFAELPTLSRPVLKLLRSGAYVSHDDGHYRHITPFNRVPEEGELHPAFRLWAQVVSRPEPGQAFLNAGKRDAAYDLDMPEPQLIRSARDTTTRPATGLTITALSDQHAWVSVADDTTLEVGDWVAMGLSHPCTSFDKWQLIPVAESDGTVTDYIRTFF
ncbi:alanine racemase [Streptomyces rapamycinicus]|uniref:Amino acid deaminase n=2 Tax=Streptomyces rapamycinicus TaxID=1226757 RepID=A0A0A0NEE4_STRRN|nr:alanine racemase [Streptomyces rapamycinicus]AGP55354.1 amino acid deaminase [Streptomyces rapamycinicus NRRL 5491]MBB4782908.1 D-serine deaminase-like pyridoxal phosphate-dependent protein [Streptomyces rapamycinicus]RLV81612.1 amino acid deaminase [Streptomyces rapamycinicus NRRL 5491]UTO63371.1 amino acid deaminase [Streptomyces rapamycinicus]UTP31329.1 amino acid deaminase [Streptomyces rapamycinicus NRRL 5491]